MTTVLLTVHFFVAVFMIVSILLQRSEGGALGLGGGGGVSSLMSGRGTANALSRTTVILAAIFLATSLALAMIAKSNSHGSSIVTSPGNSQPGAPRHPGILSGPAPSTPAAPSPQVSPIPVPSGPAPSGAAPSPSGAGPSPSAPPATTPSAPAPAPASGGTH